MRTALRNYRKKLKLTQREAAELAGIPRPTYTMIELGRRNPTQRTMQRIADGLHISPDIFFLDKVTPHHKEG